MKTRIAAVLLAATLLAAPGLARAQDDSLEQLAVEMAHTSAQHQALARYFHAKAEAARADARLHKSMASSYGGGKLTQGQQMRSHCADLADKYNAVAADYDALAKLHEDEAKQAK